MLRKIRRFFETLLFGEPRDISIVRQKALGLLDKQGVSTDHSTWRDIVVTKATLGNFAIERFQAWGEMWEDTLEVVYLPTATTVFCDQHEKNWLFFEYRSSKHHKRLCDDSMLIEKFLLLDIEKLEFEQKLS